MASPVGKRRRPTINSPWKRSRWPKPHAAFELLGAEEYLAAFRRAHGWFHGRNSLQRPLADVRCGACYDGLQASGVNRNQGAESTLAYLWAEICNTEVLHLEGANPRAAVVSEYTRVK